MTTEVVDKQILMDTETGSVNISQDAQQKIMHLRYLSLHSVGTHNSLLTSLVLPRLSPSCLFTQSHYLVFPFICVG